MGNFEITENIVVKNTPMKLTMAQKKSMIVLNLHIERLDLTKPKIQWEQKVNVSKFCSALLHPLAPQNANKTSLATAYPEQHTNKTSKGDIRAIFPS